MSTRTELPIGIRHRGCAGPGKLVSVTRAEPSIEFLGSEILFLYDGSYRWLRLHRFGCDPDASDGALLQALLQHVRYQDMYIQSEDTWTPSGDRHGPYWLDRLSVECFEPVDVAEAKTSLHRWAEAYDGREGRGFETIMQSGRRIIERASSTWRLRDLRESAQHDLGSILDEYLEMVAVERPDERLTLMVASAD